MVSERRKEQLRKASQTFRDKKRIERKFNMIREEQQEQSIPSVEDKPTVPDLIPDYNYHCPLGQECKDAKYDCKLSEEYHKCKYYILKYPAPTPQPSNIKYPDWFEQQQYEGLRNRKDKFSTGI